MSEDVMIRPGQTCDGCGACCLSIGYPPFTGMYENEDPEWMALPKELAEQALQGAIDGRASKHLPCVWLDVETRKCTQYKHRPRICREFEPGINHCINHRKLHRIE